MLQAVTLLLVCQLSGELAARMLGLPLPGPVLGMVFLAVGLGVHGKVPEGLRATCHGILGHLLLLYVPAGVGVMVHARALGDEIVAILVALLVSTWLTIIVGSMTFRIVARLTGVGEDTAEAPRSATEAR